MSDRPDEFAARLAVSLHQHALITGFRRAVSALEVAPERSTEMVDFFTCVTVTSFPAFAAGRFVDLLCTLGMERDAANATLDAVFGVEEPGPSAQGGVG